LIPWWDAKFKIKGTKMKLFEQVKQDRMSARKAKNESATSVLTTLVGELESQAKRIGSEVTDEMVVQTCKKFILNNSETLKLTITTEVNEKLSAENETLKVYLPVQLTEQDLRVIVTALNTAKLSDIMQHLKTNYNGQYDGKVASAVAKEFV
jgi:uncharacterized protein YqeY